MFGSVTSRVAALSVQDPFINTEPYSQTLFAGQSTAFQVAADGTAPLHWQWRKNGTNLAGATLASLPFPQLQTVDRGSYDAVVCNAFGLRNQLRRAPDGQPGDPGPNLRLGG